MHKFKIRVKCMRCSKFPFEIYQSFLLKTAATWTERSGKPQPRQPSKYESSKLIRP